MLILPSLLPSSFLRHKHSYLSGARRWWVRIIPGDDRMPTLFCIPDTGLTRLESFYFVPDLGPTETKWPVVVREGKEWLSQENRLSSLADLYSVAIKAMESHPQ